MLLERRHQGDIKFTHLFIQAICNSSCCWFIDDSQHIQTWDHSGVFCGLSLRVVEVGWYGNNCIGYSLQQRKKRKCAWTYVTWSRGMSRMSVMLFLRYWPKWCSNFFVLLYCFQHWQILHNSVTRYPIVMGFASKWSILKLLVCAVYCAQYVFTWLYIINLGPGMHRAIDVLVGSDCIWQD